MSGKLRAEMIREWRMICKVLKTNIPSTLRFVLLVRKHEIELKAGLFGEM